MKINTEKCKQLIVDYCFVNGQNIIKTNFGNYTDVWLGKNATSITEAVTPMLVPSNWKRGSKKILKTKDIEFYKSYFKKYKSYESLNPQSQILFENMLNNNKIYERIFDCFPYDGQLRAYVYSTDSEILYLEVLGE